MGWCSGTFGTCLRQHSGLGLPLARFTVDVNFKIKGDHERRIHGHLHNPRQLDGPGHQVVREYDRPSRGWRPRSASRLSRSTGPWARTTSCPSWKRRTWRVRRPLTWPSLPWETCERRPCERSTLRRCARSSPRRPVNARTRRTIGCPRGVIILRCPVLGNLVRVAVDTATSAAGFNRQLGGRLREQGKGSSPSDYQGSSVPQDRRPATNGPIGCCSGSFDTSVQRHSRLDLPLARPPQRIKEAAP
jgi:hypothetical protein